MIKMKEFTDLINRLLEGFESKPQDTEEIEIKKINVFENTEGISYLDVQLEGNLPKVALDEIFSLGYEIYHVSPAGLGLGQGDFRIGFYKEDSINLYDKVLSYIDNETDPGSDEYISKSKTKQKLANEFDTTQEAIESAIEEIKRNGKAFEPSSGEISKI